MKINNFATISIDLESLTNSIDFSKFPGENSNQDPCFTKDENGFENFIYNKDIMVSGYTVCFTVKKNKKTFPLNCELNVSIFFFDCNVEQTNNKNFILPINTNIKDFQNKILSTVREVLKKNK